MEKQVKVTVVTICYNCREDLQRTINSVVSQTYANIEYIIIDGGSSDGSVDIIKTYQANISKWISEKDNGVYDAMNKGINLATGDWIIFMNAGDMFYDNMVVENIFSKKYEDEVGIIYGDVAFDFGCGRKLRKSYGKFTQNTVIPELCHQAVLTKTHILKDIKYDTTYRICADLDSFVKVNEKGKRLKYIPIMIAIFEVTDGISSNRPFQSLLERKKIYGYRYLSYRFIKNFSKATVRYVLLKILPKSLYDSWRFKKVKNLDNYEEL